MRFHYRPRNARTNVSGSASNPASILDQIFGRAGVPPAGVNLRRSRSEDKLPRREKPVWISRNTAAREQACDGAADTTGRTGDDDRFVDKHRTLVVGCM